eukprot:678852-Heterocapsa_arctica.AAC.1
MPKYLPSEGEGEAEREGEEGGDDSLSLTRSHGSVKDVIRLWVATTLAMPPKQQNKSGPSSGQPGQAKGVSPVDTA